MLTKISIDVNVRTGEVSFSLPDLGLSTKETIIEDYIWQEVKEELVSGQEVWGMIELGYRDPDDSARPRIPGKIRLMAFQNFCPYTIDLEYFKDISSHFDVSEWIDILLGAIDYNADGYQSEEEKAHDVDPITSLRGEAVELDRTCPQRYRKIIPIWTGKQIWLAFFRWRHEPIKAILRSIAWDRRPHCQL